MLDDEYKAKLIEIFKATKTVASCVATGMPMTAGATTGKDATRAISHRHQMETMPRHLAGFYLQLHHLLEHVTLVNIIANNSPI